MLHVIESEDEQDSLPSRRHVFLSEPRPLRISVCQAEDGGSQRGEESESEEEGYSSGDFDEGMETKDVCLFKVSNGHFKTRPHKPS